ncbi:ATP-binding protein [Clostridium sp. KNHs205]|uniref:ATP-binding protein n=1 Tax=Clostridium sp. KNHs205 TaxID=1449050 RepID=UPI00051BD8E4|nr:ATP-binding protein [Clostridium sp. KNHs205]
MKTKSLPPYAPTLIESTRAIGYSLEAAVADIIDNSIAANAKNVDIYFFPVDGAYIAILDNGKGMTEEEIDIAMQYGSKNPTEERDKKDLGRFGLGLKTASLSQCRCLTVISKQGGELEGRQWDIDHVTEVGDWSLIVLDEDELNQLPQIDELKKYETGTLVIWQKLDRLKAGEINFELSLGRKIDRVRDHLSLVYHRYIAGESGITKLKLSINGEKVKAIDPFLTEKSVQAMDDESLVIQGNKILVRAYILPHISKLTADEIKMLGGKDGLRKQQGFYVYRNKRLLVWGTWFRMMRQGDLSKLARIRVDIPNTLDDLWTLDIKKSSALPPAEVRKNLEIIITQIAERSKRTWTFRGKKEVSDTETHVWNRMKNKQGGFYYEVNRDHPLVQQLVKANPNMETSIYALLQQIEIGLPLNQLYVDLNNDEQIINDNEQSDIEIKKSLEDMITMCAGKQEKCNLLDAVAGIEPYSAHTQIIEKLKEEILENE